MTRPNVRNLREWFVRATCSLSFLSKKKEDGVGLEGTRAAEWRSPDVRALYLKNVFCVSCSARSGAGAFQKNKSNDST